MCNAWVTQLQALRTQLVDLKAKLDVDGKESRKVTDEANKEKAKLMRKAIGNFHSSFPQNLSRWLHSKGHLNTKGVAECPATTELVVTVTFSEFSFDSACPTRIVDDAAPGP